LFLYLLLHIASEPSSLRIPFIVTCAIDDEADAYGDSASLKSDD